MRPFFRGAEVLLGFLFYALSSTSIVAQTTINVPANQPTIQAGINAANNGDTVLVAPGTYSENINFNGKAITVTSSGGAAQTIIDGAALDSVVFFDTGEGPGSVLNGFTIQNGAPHGNGRGSGVYISSASPTIANNVIQNNAACAGAGIYSNAGGPKIQGNVIQNNVQPTVCLGAYAGGGIYLGFSNSAQITGNVIVNNLESVGDGGGIGMNGPNGVNISNNIIANNQAGNLLPDPQGGGIYIINLNNIVITQNVLYGNTSGTSSIPGLGSGIYASGSPGLLTLTNNTIVGSGSSQAAVYGGGQFMNNLVIGPPGRAAIYCGGGSPGIYSNNDAYTPNGIGFDVSCGAQAGQSGNISVDPLFINPAAGNFHLQTTSPAIDAGTNSAPNLPQTDIAGIPRILDGNNDCVSTIDMGAYELALKANASLSPTSLAFAPQILNTTSAAKTVMLSNTGATCFQFSSLGTSGDYAQTNNCSAGVRGSSSCTFNVTFRPAALGKRIGALNISGGDGTTNSNLSASLAGIGVDFSVAVSPTSASVHHGQPITVKVSVTPLGGKFTSPIALSCSGMPAFSLCTFSPASVTPGELVATSTLTIAAGDRAALGNFNILINGTSGADVHSANLLLTIF